MKIYHIIVYSFLSILVLGCKVVDPLNKVVQVNPSTVIDKVPYHVVLEQAIEIPVGFQSFAFGHSGDNWLIVGGRINGFHKTGGGASTFPTNMSNDRLWVINSVTGDTASVPLTEEYKYWLRSTNMPFAQDGDMLYVVGGYGSNCNEDLSSCYQTYPVLTAINVPNVINAVLSRSAGDVAQHIQYIRHEGMRVTGGLLVKADDYFYLVFGQNYRGKYHDANNGVYTEQIRKFKIDHSGNQLSITDFQTISDRTGAVGTDSEFHRRDLNVVPAIHPSGRLGLDVYGGVFNASGSAYLNPIFISTDNNYQVVEDFEQTMNLYECGHILMYDQTTRTMFTTMLGGIGTGYYGDDDTLVTDPDLPFAKAITTLAHRSDNSMLQFVQPADQQMPGFLGANAIFVAEDALGKMAQHHKILDYNAIPAGNKVLLGKMYGGIVSTSIHPSRGSSGNKTNRKIYNVYLVRD